MLAVFATKVAGVEDDTVEDVVVITEEKKQKLKDVFWDMHEITSRTETITNGETSESTPPRMSAMCGSTSEQSRRALRARRSIRSRQPEKGGRKHETVKASKPYSTLRDMILAGETWTVK